MKFDLLKELVDLRETLEEIECEEPAIDAAIESLDRAIPALLQELLNEEAMRQ